MFQGAYGKCMVFCYTANTTYILPKMQTQTAAPVNHAIIHNIIICYTHTQIIKPHQKKQHIFWFVIKKKKIQYTCSLFKDVFVLSTSPHLFTHPCRFSWCLRFAVTCISSKVTRRDTILILGSGSLMKAGCLDKTQVFDMNTLRSFDV